MVTYLLAETPNSLPASIFNVLKHCKYPNGDWTRSLGGSTPVNGQANLCCITGTYKSKPSTPGENEAGFMQEIFEDGTFYMASRNEGQGGDHSEPVALQKLQMRSVKENSTVYIFTERAPCGGCQESINVRGQELDIVVYFATPYTHNNQIYDVVKNNYIAGQSPGDAQSKVAHWRNLFLKKIA